MNRTFYSRIMSLCLSLTILVLIVKTQPVQAESDSTDFEPSGWTTGDINQNDWSMTGDLDVAVVENTYGYDSFGDQSLRMSNSVVTDNFGQMPFSSWLTDEAGETDAVDHSHSGGNRQPFFEAEWDIATASPDEQPGLKMSISPESDLGDRMSFLRFEDGPSGIDVFFDDYLLTDQFNENQIASGLTRSTPHHIRITMNFVDGPVLSTDESNDIVCVYVDDNAPVQGVSWEQYYRYDPEQSTYGGGTRTVDALMFRIGGTVAPAAANLGFLFDNFRLRSGSVPSGYADGCPAGGNNGGNSGGGHSSNDSSESGPSNTHSGENVGGATGGAITIEGAINQATNGSTTGNVYGSVIVQDGQFLADPAMIGIPELLKLNIKQAINLFGLLPGGVSTFDFVSPVTVCLRGSGPVFFVDAETHTIHELPGTPSGEYTCVQVPAAGLVVLDPPMNSVAPPAAAAVSVSDTTASTTLTDCHVTTEYRVNLRSGPSSDSEAVTIAPFDLTLQVTERSGDWYKVIYGDSQYYVSADLVSTQGNCG